MTETIKKPSDQAKRWDNYINILTGIGDAGRDKRMATYYQGDWLLDDVTLENLYHGNDIAARICDIVPDEMMRQGFSINLQSEDNNEVTRFQKISTDIMMKMDDLRASKKYNDSLVWANVYGASAILVGALDGRDISEPIDYDNIQDVRFLTILEKSWLHPYMWYNDPLSARYGEVCLYKLQPINYLMGETPNSLYDATIHESRLIIFDGTRTSVRKKQENYGWSISLLQRCNEVLRDFNMTWASMANLMTDVSQGVFKLDGLMQMIAEGEEERLRTRMAAVDMARGLGKSLILDAEREDFKRETARLDGIPDIINKFMLRLAAASRIPVSILMGQSPAGLNATGDSDIRWFYDTVKSAQTNILKPKLEHLVKLIMLSRNGPTNGVELDNWSIEFPPLWQNTELEKVQTRKTQAETDTLYISSGVLLPEEVTISRFRPEGYSIETIADLDIRKLELESKPGSEQLPQDEQALSTNQEPASDDVNNLTQEDIKTTDPVIQAKESLNGAQVTSIVEVLRSVATGDIPRESAIVLFQAAFGLSKETAELMVGELGTEAHLIERQQLLERVGDITSSDLGSNMLENK